MQILNHSMTKLSRDLAAPPCFSTPSGGLGLQRSAAAWLTDGRFWRRGPGRQSTCQLAFPGCFFTTKAPGLLERSRSQKRSGSFSFFHLFLCKALFWLSTLPKGGREREGLVGVDDGFGGFYRADGGGLNLLLEELHY